MVAAVIIGLAAGALFLAPVLVVALRFRKRLYVEHYTIDPYSTDGRYRRAVIKVINGARKHLTLVRGELPYTVYDKAVAEALQEASGRGVKITLVCGPQVLVPDGSEHPVLALAQKGALNLYYAKRTQREHYIEADSTILYWEKPHPPGARDREVWLFRNSYFSAPRAVKRLLADISNAEVLPANQAEGLYHLLSEKEHEALATFAKTKGLDLDILSGEVIRELRNELTQAK